MIANPSLHLGAFGGVGDGRTLNSQAFARACAAAATAGGGTIVVPPGRFRTGSIVLPDDTTLWLEAGAVIAGSEEVADYPQGDHCWEGEVARMPAPLVGARGACRVAVMGSGVIDGCGAPWWAAVRRDRSVRRPRLLGFADCRQVRVEGVTLINSPAWTLHPWACRDVLVRGVTIRNPPDSPNTDGINPESCTDVRISDCLVDVGDDCITLKSGASADGTGSFEPCERISINNCQLVRGHGAVVIGSEMSGGVRDVTIANCIFSGTDRGVRVKTRRGRGGVVENLLVSHVVMRQVGCPLVVNAFYRYTNLPERMRQRAANPGAEPVTAGTPVVRGIRMQGVTAVEVGGPCLGFVHGLPESPVADLVMSDCDLQHAEQPAEGMGEPAMMLNRGAGDYATGGVFLTHAAGVAMRGVVLRPRAGQPVVLEDVSGFEGP